MNQIVVPTGYMGSGSSAITNILSEITGYDQNKGEFEFVMMHCPDGLFDLEDKLLMGNNALRSDEAIHRFMLCMKELYCKKNYWVSGYREKVSCLFYQHCQEFISEICDFNIRDSYWYYQQKPDTLYIQLINYIRRFLGKISLGIIRLERPVKYKDMRISFTDSEKFYVCSKKFLACIFKDLGLDRHNLVLDQFLLPHNLFRIEHYFGADLRVIVVERDPRDIFLLNKYVWKPQGVAVPFPLDVHKFINFYKKMRNMEKNQNDKRIMRIHFEDLIYKYEETLNDLYDFLGIEAIQHVRKGSIFLPSRSIINTQIFTTNIIYYDEISVMEEQLKEFLYPFPKINIERSDLHDVF